MMIVIATAIAVLAVLAGVLLAALDLPQAATDRRTQRMSLVLVIATSVTAVAGVTYAFIA
jgi:hypothetical protein